MATPVSEQYVHINERFLLTLCTQVQIKRKHTVFSVSEYKGSIEKNKSLNQTYKLRLYFTCTGKDKEESNKLHQGRYRVR